MGGFASRMLRVSRTNDLGQQIGRDLKGWSAPSMVSYEPLGGRYVVLRPLRDEDADAVYGALRDGPDSLWTYMTFDPFRSPHDPQQLIRFMRSQPDWRPYAIEVENKIEGFATYLRIKPLDGVIEIGNIMYSPRLQRTTAATEAVYLLMSHAFESGYRRVEWKCDALNVPSRVAGERLGFTYEGTFRNATHYKGRNRDTAWFAITAEHWPAHRETLETWLDPTNFDGDGQQLRTLSQIRR